MFTIAPPPFAAMRGATAPVRKNGAVHLVRWPEREHAGVVDQHVNAVYLLGQALDVLEALQVGPYEFRPESIVHERAFDLSPAPLVAPGDHHIRPRGCVRAGGRLPDPGRAAGHEHFLALDGHDSSLLSLDSMVYFFQRNRMDRKVQTSAMLGE
jgi:hypothetical protein